MNYSWQTKSNFPVWLGKRISQNKFSFFRAHLFLCDLIVPLYFQLLGFQNILYQKDTTTSVIILVTFCKSFRITQSKMSPIFFVLNYCWRVLALKIVCVKAGRQVPIFSYFFLFFSAYSYFSYFLAISSYFSYFLAILLTTSKYSLEIWTF